MKSGDRVIVIGNNSGKFSDHSTRHHYDIGMIGIITSINSINAIVRPASLDNSRYTATYDQIVDLQHLKLDVPDDNLAALHLLTSGDGFG